MAADDFLIDEWNNGLGSCIMKGASFHPFGEMVYCNHNVSFSSESAWKRAYNVDANLIEWDGVFLNGFQWGFSFSTLILLTGSTSAHILDDVSFHPWPIVELGGTVIGVVLALMACKLVIMNFFQYLRELMVVDNLTISVLSSSKGALPTFVQFEEGIFGEGVEMCSFGCNALSFFVNGGWDLANCQELDNPVIEVWIHSVVREK